ncbi:MAG: M16 family metallopeptidase [Alkalispirochaeta sp.]
MRRSDIHHIALSIFLLVVTSVVLPARGIPEPGAHDSAYLETTIPFREEIVRGRLDNGMEYFAVRHPRPEDKVVLRLVVDAGSVVETDSQQGLAHFVEHMAFNGTEEYGEDELVAYLESLGIRFGPDVNAYTSFDETVYKLEIPADDEEALATGFSVMEQWASALTFEPDAIDRERGVIVEEWRGGRGAAQRMQETHIPVLFAGSRYAERLPIGDMEIVRNAPRREFVSFYDRWYRPDNMALIAAGDLPAEELEAHIREHFSSLARPTENLNRPYFTVPEHDGTRVSIATDSEAPRSTVSIYRLRRPLATDTVGDYRTLLVRSLFASILNERLRELTRDASSPIREAGIGYSRFLRDTEIAIGTVVVRDDQVREAFRILAREIERARQHGVLEEELDRARRRMLESIESAQVNFESRPAASLADELVRHWTEGESVPGIEFEYDLYQQLIPGITAAEVAEIADDFSREDNRIVIGNIEVDDSGALRSGDAVPEREEFHSILAEVESSEIAPPLPEDPAAELLADDPEGGEIVERIEHEEVETRELRLSNGMRVFLKSTDLREDEILFSAYSPGGLAVVSPEDAPAAQLAERVADESGLGNLSASALERFLAGRSTSLTSSINRVSESMSGSTRRADQELLFQMIYAAFTAPRFDESAWDTVRQETIQQLQSSAVSPQGRYSRRLQELFAGESPRLAPLTTEEVERVDLAQMRDIYADRFDDPGDFSLFFVGSLEVEEMEELAERYLAAIPQSETTEELIPEDTFPRPEGITDDTVYAGSEPVAQLVMVLHGPYEWSQEENHRFNSMVSILNIRLREEIREAMGGAYSVGAGGWRWRQPRPWSYAQIAFGLDPERVPELRERALEIVTELAEEAPAETYVERVQAQQRDQYRQGLQENDYWLSVLQFSVEHNRELSRILEYPELVESLTAEEVRERARRYLNPDRRIELLLLPEDAQDDTGSAR